MYIMYICLFGFRTLFAENPDVENHLFYALLCTNNDWHRAKQRAGNGVKYHNVPDWILTQGFIDLKPSVHVYLASQSTRPFP